jgi:hypothetical protein
VIDKEKKSFVALTPDVLKDELPLVDHVLLDCLLIFQKSWPKRFKINFGILNSVLKKSWKITLVDVNN